MSLFVRHSAWLNAIPERPKNDKSDKPRLSRRESLKNEPDMPPVEGAEYLLEYLWEVGPAAAAGMGEGPVTHEELLAWQSNTGIELSTWEARTLRRLSCDYVSESRAAEKLDAKAPWRAADAKPEISDTQQALRALANL